MTIKKAEQSIVPIILRKPNGSITKEAGGSIVPRKPYAKKICNDSSMESDISFAN